MSRVKVLDVYCVSRGNVLAVVMPRPPVRAGDRLELWDRWWRVRAVKSNAVPLGSESGQIVGLLVDPIPVPPAAGDELRHRSATGLAAPYDFADLPLHRSFCGKWLEADVNQWEFHEGGGSYWGDEEATAVERHIGAGALDRERRDV